MPLIDYINIFSFYVVVTETNDISSTQMLSFLLFYRFCLLLLLKNMSVAEYVYIIYDIDYHNIV